MTRTILMLALGAGLLSGCAATAPAGLAVHEVLLYGSGQQRLTWVYGDLPAGQTADLKLAGQTVQLTPAAQTTESALLVNGNSVFRSGLSGSVTQPKVVRNAQGLFDVSSSGGISELYYTDGSNWYLLNSTAGAGITAKAVSGLQGAGELTPTEAATLTQALSGQGALAVGVLSSSSVPDSRTAAEPQAEEHRLTALSVTRVATTGVPSPVTSVSPRPVTRPGTTTPGGNVNYSILDKGTNAAADGPMVQVATSAAEAQSLYSLAYGRQSTRPSIPDMTGKTLVGIFMGMRSTGGYSLQVQSVNISGGQAQIQVRETAPGPDMLTTQALTSPWVIVQLNGRFAGVDVQGLGRSAGVNGLEK